MTHKLVAAIAQVVAFLRSLTPAQIKEIEDTLHAWKSLAITVTSLVSVVAICVYYILHILGII